MKLLRHFFQFQALAEGAAVTIGNFDGVHLGHQALFKQLFEVAHQLKLPTLVVFFEPQPDEYYDPNHKNQRLMTRQEKLKKFSLLGFDYAYCFGFNSKIAALSAEDFVYQYIHRLFRTRYLLVGEDFRFGHKRLGTLEYLSEQSSALHFNLAVYPDILDSDTRISSTQIRHLLAQGNLYQVSRLLGREYGIMGRVITGEGLARQWGFPTANIDLEKRALILQGVFLVKVQISTEMSAKSLYGVANVGTRPTVSGLKRLLEVHLFDFQGTLYGQKIFVFFLKQLRQEKKFSSVDELVAQIHEDCRHARSFIV